MIMIIRKSAYRFNTATGSVVKTYNFKYSDDEVISKQEALQLLAKIIGAKYNKDTSYIEKNNLNIVFHDYREGISGSGIVCINLTDAYVNNKFYKTMNTREEVYAVGLYLLQCGDASFSDYGLYLGYELQPKIAHVKYGNVMFEVGPRADNNFCENDTLRDYDDIFDKVKVLYEKLVIDNVLNEEILASFSTPPIISYYGYTSYESDVVYTGNKLYTIIDEHKRIVVKIGDHVIDTNIRNFKYELYIYINNTIGQFERIRDSIV